MERVEQSEGVTVETYTLPYVKQLAGSCLCDTDSSVWCSQTTQRRDGVGGGGGSRRRGHMAFMVRLPSLRMARNQYNIVKH